MAQGPFAAAGHAGSEDENQRNPLQRGAQDVPLATASRPFEQDGRHAGAAGAI